jgi:hypothetical protein
MGDIEVIHPRGHEPTIGVWIWRGGTIYARPRACGVCRREDETSLRFAAVCSIGTGASAPLSGRCRGSRDRPAHASPGRSPCASIGARGSAIRSRGGAIAANRRTRRVEVAGLHISLRLRRGRHPQPPRPRGSCRVEFHPALTSAARSRGQALSRA